MKYLNNEENKGFFCKLGQAFDVAWMHWTKPSANSHQYHILLAMIAMFSCIIGAWTWYPGLISDDAMGQYLQAIGVAPLGDWHPPIFAWFWWLEIKIFHTASLLDATWICLSAIGLYLFLRSRPCFFSLVLFLLIFFSPAFFGMNGLVYKDIPLSWLLLIASALLFSLLFTYQQRSPWIVVNKIVITTLLLLVCLLRVNGAFIAVPLLIAAWWSWRFDFKHLALCLVLVLAIVPTIGWVNHTVLKATNDHAELSLEIFDLAGISFYSQNKRYDDYRERQASSHKEILNNWLNASLEDKLLTCYTPKKWDTFGGFDLPGFPYKQQGWNKWADRWNNNEWEDQWGDIHIYSKLCMALGNSFRAESVIPILSQTWKEGIKKHPIAYLKHRFAHFSTVYLGHIDERQMPATVGPWQDSGYWPMGDLDKKYESGPYKNLLSHQYRIFEKKHQGIWSNYGVFWLASALALFLLTLREEGKMNNFINLLSFSSLCYLGGYLFVGVAMEWRYLMPAAILITASILAWYVGGTEKLGSHHSRKISFWVWFVLMFWTCVI